MSNLHLILGLGGTGGRVIRSLRKRCWEQSISLVTNSSVPNTVPGVALAFLYVDSTDAQMGRDDPAWQTLGQNVQLPPESQLLLSLPTAASGKRGRAGGRDLFLAHRDRFHQLLRGQIAALANNPANDTNSNEPPVTFHLCVNLAADVAGGSVGEAVTQIRTAFGDSTQHPIFVYAILPDTTPPHYARLRADTANYHANGYAALLELNASRLFDGCYLLSNENGNGLTANTETELPDIIANLLYQKTVVLPQSGAPDARQQRKDIEAGSHFLTMGIKQIAIPEQEIREYITYTFARQATLQLEYNNWSDALSFVNEPRNQSWADYVTQTKVLERWRLADPQLRAFIGTDGITTDAGGQPSSALPPVTPAPGKPVLAVWENFLAGAMIRVRTTFRGNPKVWTEQLSHLCDLHFAEGYGGVGVERFFLGEGDALSRYARTICQFVERDLLRDWQAGTCGLADIRRILEALVKSLSVRALSLREAASATLLRSQEAQAQVNTLADEWADLGLIQAVLGGRERLWQAYGAALQVWLTCRTDEYAERFVQELLGATVGEFANLQSEVAAATELVGDTMAHLREAMEACCCDISGDLRGPMVLFYDPGTVKSTVREMVRDRAIQQRQTAQVRDRLFANIADMGEETTFGAFNHQLGRQRFTTLLLQECYRAAQTASGERTGTGNTVPNSLLLGGSVIGNLWREFGNDYESLTRYIRQIMGMAGYQARLNTRQPDPQTVPTDLTIILLPPAGTDTPSVPVAFADAVQEAFRQNMTAQSAYSLVTPPATVARPDTITVLRVARLVSPHDLEQTRYLRGRYVARLARPDGEQVRRALFTEGDGTDLPLLHSALVEYTGEAG